jgi:lipopolysaccharide transport system permease protein
MRAAPICQRLSEPDVEVRVLAAPRWRPSGIMRHVGLLAEYGDLLATLSRHRINVRYKQSILGGLWAILQPVAMMVVYTAVFSRLVRVPSDGVPYSVFAYAGLLPWTFVSAAVSNGTTSLVSHAQLVTRVYFPREILPVSYVIAAAVDLLIGSTALAGLLMYFRIPLTAAVVLIVPIVVVMAAFALACALLLSTIHVHVRDIGVALPVMLQLWLFASPVLYPLQIVPAGWRAWYMLNPMAGLIDGFRRAVLGLPIDRVSFLTAALVTAVVLPVSYAAFKHVDATMADVV